MSVEPQDPGSGTPEAAVAAHPGTGACLSGFVRQISGHLPVVLFLVAICVLGHGSRLYDWVEVLSVWMVSSATPEDRDAPVDPGRIIGIVGTRKLFTGHYLGRLPLDRGATAAFVDQVTEACPPPA